MRSVRECQGYQIRHIGCFTESVALKLSQVFQVHKVGPSGVPCELGAPGAFGVPGKSGGSSYFYCFHFFLSLGLAIMGWARVADNGRIMRQGGLLTVDQHCLRIVTSC